MEFAGALFGCYSGALVCGADSKRGEPMRLLGLTAALAAVLIVPPSTAFAQFDTAAVVGTARDTSGAVVPDATVTLTNIDTRVSATRTTNSEGVYEFATVRPGLYVVAAEKPGFAIALVDDVQVQVGARLRVDLQLQVGGVSERV